MSTIQAQAGASCCRPRNLLRIALAYGRILSCLLALFLCNSPCQAADNNNTLIAEILAREIQLQRLNKEVHLNAANPSFARARRNWFYDTGNALSTEAGLIDAVALFYRHSNDKIVNKFEVEKKNNQIVFGDKLSLVHAKIAGSAVAGSIIPQIVGQAIGGSGSFLELNADLYHLYKLHQEKLNRHAATETAKKLNDEIDSRLQQLLKSTEGNSTTLQRECRMLLDIKEISLNQFGVVEAAAAKNLSACLIEDAGNTIRNTVGGIGNSINVYADYRNNKRLNGKADILNIIAASIIITRPLVANVGSVLASKLDRSHKNKLFPESHEISTDNFRSELAQLTVSTNDEDPGARRRMAFYQLQAQQFSLDEELSDYDRKKSKQLILRRFKDTLYGPAKLSQATIGMTVGFRTRPNSTSDNRLSAAANLTYCSGQAFNITELLRERLVDEVRHRADKDKGLLPEQRIAKGLQNLDRLENMLKQMI